MPANKNDLQWKATVKAYPAIADLQAISEFIRVEDTQADVGAGNYLHNVYLVPAGKIFVMELLMGYCAQADPTKIEFTTWSGGVHYTYYSAAYGGVLEVHRWTTPLRIDEAEIVRIIWYDCLAATDVVGLVFGYLIDKY